MDELKQDCLFCKIIRGEVPSYTVFENDDVKAFLDISQVTKGHTLVVPKKHLVNFFDYSQEDAARFLQYIPVISQAIKKSDPKIKGLNVEVNNGEVAGQVVMHSHIHLIPRYSENDDMVIPHVNHADEYDEERYNSVANAIKNNF
ncbi:HIT family protein [Lactobacillus hominis]|uniref:Hit protein n=1 Tax=Lactobacillus hominis DSM 23910 = CRBIP 24.179 TaxID=1423758 RepID=I7IVN8_9LACO|nr:HIT family protein [Lactobacillus hominis]KRM85711.1 histidine triad nucleotide-binding protein [Lactobacillus hominis DSM 23910 = CRBIP 24.179]MCT3347240.1 HIT family protein [Lactobacillus hominis]CCI81768.1 Hit protein [Lactobacillus hominis DSM 23910 = CRBIP 24.179]